MDVVDGAVEPGQAGVDQVFADDRVVPPGDEDLGPEGAHGPHALQIGLDEAVPVPPQGVEVREMGEEGPEEIADQRGAALGQPHDRTVDRLPHCCVQFQAQAVDVEFEQLVERDVGHRFGLAHRHAGVFGGDAARVGSQRVEPDPRGAHAQGSDAGVVGLAQLVVLLGHVGGAVLPEEVHPADVVDVGLRGDDVVGRTRPDGIEDPLVVGRLEAHAGVDDDAPAVRQQQVGGGATARAVDALGHGTSRVVVDGLHEFPSRPSADELVHLVFDRHQTSVRTGNASR